MIKRYSRKELADIWSEENKYKIWLDVEIAAAQAMEKLGQIPKGVSSLVRKKARINVKRIHQIESQVKHDVIAFLTSVTEKAGIKARYLHQGMTSSDVLDTSFNIQLVQSGKIILKDLDQILKVLKKQRLQENAENLGKYFKENAKNIPNVKKIKGRGLMLGLEFDFEVSSLRKELIYNKHIFTGGSSNKNLLRILPPLTLQKKHFDIFFQRLKEALKAINA